MLLLSQPPCKQARDRKGPCPFLVNGRQCRSRSCRQSSYHDHQQILHWKQNAGKSRCRKGAACPHLPVGTCLWTHSLQEQAQLARIKERMTDGLEYKESLDLGALVPAQGFVSITDDRDLASFNKVSGTEIAVPGNPPRFTPLSQSLRVQSDADNKTLCLNFPRYEHPFEPLIRSIEIMAPDVNVFESADIVSNASNLRKLLHILSHKSVRAERFDLEMRGTALLLSRWNEDPSLNSSLGHGAGFERATCRYTPDDDPVLHRSLSHHRVVSYRFAGLRCVVQSEVDAYYCDCDHHAEPHKLQPPVAPIPVAVPPNNKTGRSTLSPLAAAFIPSSPSPPPSPPARKQHQNQMISITPPNSNSKKPELAFAALTLDDPGDSPTLAAAQLVRLDTQSPPTPPPEDSDATRILRIHRRGRDVPSRCLIEVKTHKAGGGPAFTPDAQLYFGRRAMLYDAAYHAGGLFVPGPELRVQDRTGALRVWEREEQPALRRLGALLGLVRGRVGEMVEKGVERVSLVCQSVGGEVRAEVYERGNGPSLVPEDVGPACGGGGRYGGGGLR